MCWAQVDDFDTLWTESIYPGKVARLINSQPSLACDAKQSTRIIYHRMISGEIEYRETSGYVEDTKRVSTKNASRRLTEAYLKKSAVNYLIKNLQLQAKFSQHVDLDNSVACTQQTTLGPRIDDIIATVESDISTKSRAACSATALLEIEVMKALKAFFQALRVNYGNFEVSKNRAGKRPPEYFISEISTDRDAFIVYFLRENIQDISHPHANLALKAFLRGSGVNLAIRHRIARYMSSYRGGMHKRLEKLYE